jgi:hypothetical protein
MDNTQVLANIYGDSWIVEHRESAHLSHIGGFLVMCGDLSCIMLNIKLSKGDKLRGRETLLERLAETPIGTDSVTIWHPDDK